MDIFEDLKDQEEGLFEKVVDSLKEAGNNIQEAKEILAKKRSQKVEEKNGENMIDI